MAVFTQITQTALDAFLTGYGLSPPFTATGIAAGVQNTNYLVTAENNRYVLTLYEDTETGVAPQDLPFFLSLMQHLGAAGISCPCPLERDGAALSGELAGRPAALVSFLGGRSAKRPSRNIATPPVPVWRKCIWPPMISARPAPTRIQSGIGRNYSPCAAPVPMRLRRSLPKPLRVSLRA